MSACFFFLIGTTIHIRKMKLWMKSWISLKGVTGLSNFGSRYLSNESKTDNQCLDH